MQRLLIANRGEIACRIARSAKAEGWSPVMVYTDIDRDALHAAAGDDAVYLGEEGHGSPYLNIATVLAAAQSARCIAVHPGFGFLSERAEFAEAVLEAGLIWVGPPPAVMRALGRKDAAKVLARELGVPVVPGRESVSGDGAPDWQGLAAEVGFPLLIKAVAGGGGRGMRIVHSADHLADQLALAAREAKESFGDGALLLERYVERGRHLEVQILADQHGRVLHLYERECSIQRRHQKIVEEAPSPALSAEQRQALTAAAVRLAAGVGYVSVGTVEFLLDDDTGEFFFLEVNTRIQVEHPVTELVTGLDLVAWQLRIALGQPLSLAQADILLSGHAIEVRICAEDPLRDFLPQAGTIVHWQPPQLPHVRVDHGLHTVDRVPLHYDAMVAKVIAWGETRMQAIDRLATALRQTQLHGIVCNRDYLQQIVNEPEFRAGLLTTSFVAEHPPLACLPAQDDELVAAALYLHGPQLQKRFRNNPSRPDITVFGVTEANATEQVYVALQHVRGSLFHWGIKRLPDPLLTEVPATPHTAELLTHATGLLEARMGMDRRRWWLHQADSQVYVQDSTGRQLVLQLLTLLPERAKAEANTGSVTAPGAAVVVTVLVQPGDVVAEDAVLLTMEAMKMLTVLRAPKAGTIAAVYAAVGDSVAAGQVLIEFAD
jgi:acetyl/propionyl-CoA carboxylase alpha subunit